MENSRSEISLGNNLAKSAFDIILRKDFAKLLCEITLRINFENYFTKKHLKNKNPSHINSENYLAMLACEITLRKIFVKVEIF